MTQSIPGFRPVPKTGVIYVTSRAIEMGFSTSDPDWANLGQGSPETGPIPDAPLRIAELKIHPGDQGYSPIAGDIELRTKVAEYYNHKYRQGKKSQYTYENVCIAGGGRTALTRLAVALGNVNMGHFLPDYTAYEELLSVFKAFTPIPILLDEETGYRIEIKTLRKEILGLGLGALLLSNPCNPTGQLIEGERLKNWADLARETECTFIFDEFYSHFVYLDANSTGHSVSAASYIEDVETDPIIVVNGVTKNWRYPGWRISWTLGPKSVIETVASAGSFLDGGANSPLQRQVSELLNFENADKEIKAIQKLFRAKRDLTVCRLKSMGIIVDQDPLGTFYVWADLSNLPEKLRDGMSFFEECLKEKVITVPGIFFDVNPNRRRSLQRYKNYSRISFGPEMEKLVKGLDSIERTIKKFR